ncbi:MAG: ankyrin repeat domain-containing protein [Cyanobacteria bacterium]|nr:ankyrin repeat domain-containing protein [Cyanobacteriota bacterium]
MPTVTGRTSTMTPRFLGSQPPSSHLYGSMLLEAIQKGNDAEALKLIQNKPTQIASFDAIRDEEQRTPLLTAILCKRLSIFQALLKAHSSAGASVDAFDKTLSHALIHAARKNLGPEFLTPILNQTRRPIDTKDGEGMTALMHAALRGNPQTVQMLLQRGARVDVTDNTGKNALMYACIHGNPDLVEVLAKHSSASLNAVDSENHYSALMHAISSEQTEAVRRLLRHATIDSNLADKENQKTALMMAAEGGDPDLTRLVVYHKGTDLNKRDLKKQTAFHYAVQAGKIQNVRVLVHHQANVNAADQDFNTPLMRAVTHRKPSLEMVNALLQAPTMLVDARNKDKQSALMLASAKTKNMPGILESLLNKGASASAIDGEGKPALIYAVEHERFEYIPVLLPKTDAQILGLWLHRLGIEKAGRTELLKTKDKLIAELQKLILLQKQQIDELKNKPFNPGNNENDGNNGNTGGE